VLQQGVKNLLQEGCRCWCWPNLQRITRLL